MERCAPVRAAGATVPRGREPVGRHSVFRRCCGKLQYASPKRPDLLYALQELGRHLAAPREADFKCLKHTLRYVKGAFDLGMVHRISGSIEELIGSCDSDWAGCHETRKSTCCGVIKWASIFITSYSRTESVRAPSSPEAECLAGVVFAAEMIYVSGPIHFWGFPTRRIIECDASSAIAIMSRRGVGKLRHLEASGCGCRRRSAWATWRCAGFQTLSDIGTKDVLRSRPWKSTVEPLGCSRCRRMGGRASR